LVSAGRGRRRFDFKNGKRNLATRSLSMKGSIHE
jgi:hypothetical protein